MTKEEHKNSIVTQIHSQTIGNLVETLAATAAELETAKAEIATLKAQLSPQPAVD